MGSGRARKRKNKALEAQFEKTHGGRRAQWAPAAEGTQKRQRADDGLSRDMRKMLSMKRMIENRKRKKEDVGTADGGVERSTTATMATTTTKRDEEPMSTATVTTGAEANTVDTCATEEPNGLDPLLSPLKPKKSKNKYAHLLQSAADEVQPLSKSKQRKRDYMRNKKKGKLKAQGVRSNDTGSSDEEGIGKDEGGSGRADRADKAAFGEQADAPMKEVLRSKHWAEAPKREGVDPAVSIVGLGAAMGARRVAGMDSKALAALYRNQKKSRVEEGNGGGGLGHPRATRESLKQLVRQGRSQTSDH